MASKRKEIRNVRFKELLENDFKGSRIDMANFLGLAPDLISRYAKNKGIGEDIKNLVEEKCKKNRDWLDGVDDQIYYDRNDEDLINILKDVIRLAGNTVEERERFKRIIKFGEEISKSSES